MRTTKLGRKSASLLAGSALLWGGGCVPDNFWMDTWGTTLTTAVATVTNGVVNAYVVTPIMASIEDAATGG